MTDARLRQSLADFARRLHARGWVANHDGNVTARIGTAGDAGQGRYLATPTATSKADVTSDNLIIVDEGGRAVSGAGKPFSEIGLHLTIYRARPDVHAIVHAHPPTATGFSVAGVSLLDQPLIAEAVVSLGTGVPTVPFAQPGEAACRALSPFLAAHDAVLVQNHGVFAWGRDLEQAYLRLELVEHLARIALVAHQLGGARPVPREAIPGLLEARRKAGLGAAASVTAGDAPGAAPPRAVFACAPPPPGSDVVLVEDRKKSRSTSSAVPPQSGDLAAIIREEIAAALKK